MAKTTRPLTNKEVKQAKEKEYNRADRNVLYLRIKPIGSKIRLFNYSKPNTKKRANLPKGSLLAMSNKH